jgi:hypothetical protein
MALRFDGASKLIYAGAVRGYAAYPLSVFAWVYWNNGAQVPAGMAVGQGYSGPDGNSYRGLYVGSPGATAVERYDFTTGANLYAPVDANKWYPLLGTYQSGTIRAGYSSERPLGLDGTYGSGGYNPASESKFFIGCNFPENAFINYIDIAEVAVWKGYLGPADFELLNKGVRPDLVRPQDLLDYWSLEKYAATQVGKYGTVLTATGTATTPNGMHPSVWVPVNKPATTGELDDLSIEYLTGTNAWGAAVGESSQSFSGLPVGRGLFIELLAENSTPGTVNDVRLSVNGPPQFVSPAFNRSPTNGYKHTMLLGWPNISEEKQTLTVTIGGTLQNLGVHFWRVTGHDKQRMIGTRTESIPSMPSSVAMESPGNGLMVLVQDSSTYKTYGGVMNGAEWTTPFYTAAWNSPHVSISRSNSGQGLTTEYDATSSSYTFFELRRGEKQRKSHFITVREPWTSQPHDPAATGIDWDNPITRGLALVYDKGRVVYPAQGSTYSDPVQRLKGHKLGLMQGFGIEGSGATDGDVVTTTIRNKMARQTTVVWCRLSPNAGPFTGTPLDFRIYDSPYVLGSDEYLSATLDASSYFIYSRSASVSGMWIFAIANSMDDPNGYLPWPAAGETCMLAVAHDTSPGVGPLPPTFYYNGQAAFAYEVGTPSGTWTEGFTPITIGRRSVGGGNYSKFDGWIGPFMRFNRLLSSDEIASLYKNPYQVYAARKRCIFTGAPVITHKQRRLV